MSNKEIIDCEHSFSKTIYYSDTDLAGVVYYANYLTYAEHARSELFHSLGIQQLELIESHKIGFIVAEANIEYKQSATLDDRLTIKTKISDITNKTLTFNQVFYKNGDASRPITIIKVRLVCLGADYRPTGIPEHLVNEFKKYSSV
jgi:acyl-CoA thioester hydrolase